MNIFAHASVGWLLAEAGRGDPRFRRCVFFSAVLPDLDGFNYLFGSMDSLEQHHVWTHNLCFSLLISGLAMLYGRPRWFRPLGLMVLLSLIFKRTPLEAFSPRLDRALVRAVSRAARRATRVG
jgi:hypothetical protein